MMECIMTIYIVKNQHDEEISAYSQLAPAEEIAVQLREATFQNYTVEELLQEPTTGES